MEGKASAYEFPENRVARGGATARVSDCVREAMVFFELAPGTPLDKASLSMRIGASRYPIWALARLQAEGLVEIQPQRGSIASRIRLADAHENMFVRRSLEIEAVRQLAGRIASRTLAALNRNLRYQKSAFEVDDGPDFHQLDLEFHDILSVPLAFRR